MTSAAEPTGQAIAVVEERVAIASRESIPTQLGEMSDLAFEHAIARAKTAQKRLKRLFDEVLVENAHYGNPELPGGKKAFNKPICYKQGADSLAEGFRLRVEKSDTPDDVTLTEEFTSVTVTRVLIDWAGNVVDRATASCNTKEKRFRSKYGDGWTYKDARECLNDCYAMAEKRAKVRMVVATLGLGPWLGSEEEMEAALDQEDRPLQRWTDEEKRAVYAAAQQKGIGKNAFAKLVTDTLGRPDVGTGDDVQRLLAAIGKHAAPVAAEPEQSDEEIQREDQETVQREAAATELPLGDTAAAPPKRRARVMD